MFEVGNIRVIKEVRYTNQAQINNSSARNSVLSWH